MADDCAITEHGMGAIDPRLTDVVFEYVVESLREAVAALRGRAGG